MQTEDQQIPCGSRHSAEGPPVPSVHMKTSELVFIEPETELDTSDLDKSIVSTYFDSVAAEPKELDNDGPPGANCAAENVHLGNGISTEGNATGAIEREHAVEATFPENATTATEAQTCSSQVQLNITVEQTNEHSHSNNGCSTPDERRRMSSGYETILKQHFNELADNDVALHVRPPLSTSAGGDSPHLSTSGESDVTVGLDEKDGRAVRYYLCSYSCLVNFAILVLGSLFLALAVTTIITRYTIYNYFSLDIQTDGTSWETYAKYADKLEIDHVLEANLTREGFIEAVNKGFKEGFTIAQDLINSHCDGSMIRRAAEGKIDEVNCGPEGRNLPGCLAGFYQYRYQYLEDTNPNSTFTLNNTAHLEDTVYWLNDTAHDLITPSGGIRQDQVLNVTVPSFIQNRSIFGLDDQEEAFQTAEGFEVKEIYGTQACPPGFFCPANLLCIIMCASGSYCPQSYPLNTTELVSNITADEEDEPLPECRYRHGIDRDTQFKPLNISWRLDPATKELDLVTQTEMQRGVDNGTYSEYILLNECPGAKYQYLCPPGRFCPRSTATQSCPTGSFCRKGVVQPKSCSNLLVCDSANMSAPMIAEGALLGSVLCLIAAYSGVLVMRHIKKHRNLKIEEMQKRDTSTSFQSPIKNPIQKLSRFGSVTFLLHKPMLLAPLKHLAYRCAYRCLHLCGAVKKIPSEFAAPLQSQDTPSISLLAEKTDALIDLKANNLGLMLNASGKQVLNGISGEFYAGHVTAIMGPSGSGKTSFMNALSGKAAYGTITGTIEINGQRDQLVRFSNFIGFVPQDDIMLTELTVRETLQSYASLRLPRDATPRAIVRVVEEVIDVLSLKAVEHSEIGDETQRGISGGQRKRVNIGMELVALPSLLFLDEPTSGLDSTTSFSVVEVLHISAQRGVNIVMVLHQPSYQLFQLLHNVLFLGFGGHAVYLGPTLVAHKYFEAIGFRCPDLWNPADFMMDIIACKMRRRTVRSPHKANDFDIDTYLDRRDRGFSGASAVSEPDEDDQGEEVTLGDLITAWTLHGANWRTRRPTRHRGEELPQHRELNGNGNSMERLRMRRSTFASLTSTPTAPPKALDAAAGGAHAKMSSLDKLSRQHSEGQASPARSSNGDVSVPSYGNLKQAARRFQAISFAQCTWLFMARAFVQHSKRPSLAFHDCIQHMFAALIVGLMYSNVNFKNLSEMNFMFSLALGLTVGLASLRIFGGERVVYWREAAPGAGMNLNKTAYFLAKNLSELPRLALLVVMLLSLYYPLASPRMHVTVYWLICFCAAFCVSGWSYLLSVSMEPKNAQLAMVVLILIFAMFSGVSPRLSEIDKIDIIGPAMAWISFARWMCECLYVEETQKMSDAWRMPPRFLKTSSDSVLRGLSGFTYTEGISNVNLVVMFVLGMSTRFLAYLALVYGNPDKMGKKSWGDLLMQKVDKYTRQRMGY